MTTDPFRLPVRVYIENTDAGGIVFHSEYLNFLERARTEFMRQLGFDKTWVHQHKAMMVVHSLDVAYRSPAFLDDVVEAEAVPVELKRASITFRQNIYRGDTLLVKARVKIACVDKGSQKPVPIPEQIVEKVREHLCE